MLAIAIFSAICLNQFRIQMRLLASFRLHFEPVETESGCYFNMWCNLRRACEWWAAVTVVVAVAILVAHKKKKKKKKPRIVLCTARKATAWRSPTYISAARRQRQRHNNDVEKPNCSEKPFCALPLKRARMLNALKVNELLLLLPLRKGATNEGNKLFSKIRSKSARRHALFPQSTAQIECFFERFWRRCSHRCFDCCVA